MIQLALLPPPNDRHRKMAVRLLYLGPIACGALAIWLGQDANWDLRNYHWYNAHAFLNNRHGFDLLPSQTPFFYSPFLDLPLYWLARILPTRACGFVLGAVQGLNFSLLFMLCHAMLNISRSGQRVAMAAALAALGMMGGGGIAQIGTTFYDNIVSIGILASTLLAATAMPYLIKLPSSQTVPRAFLYGLPAGLALGLKLTVIFYCAGITLAWLFSGGDFGRRLRLMLGFGAGIAVGALITQGYWMWFLWRHYSNPFFPYFNQLFHSPYAPLTSARDTQFIPGDWRSAVALPLNFALNPKLVGEIMWRDLRLPLLYLLLPFCVVAATAVGQRRGADLPLSPAMPARYLLWAAGLSYLIWLGLFSIYRYLVVLEMLAPLLIALCIGMLPLRRQSQFMIIAVLLLGIVAAIRPGDWGRAPWSSKFIATLPPPIADAGNTLLLMGGYEPYSHILPAMPRAMPVIRFQSNFADPLREHGFNRIIRARIDEHQGKFLLLLPSWQIPYSEHIQIALATFNLRFLPQNCRNFPDNLGNAFALCAAERMNVAPLEDE